MIVRATTGDIPRLIEMGREFHSVSGVASPFDPEAAKATLTAMIWNPAAVVLVSERGGIGGALVPSYVATSWVMAVEMFWWARGDGLPLLRAFEAWADEQGAQEVRMTTLTALPRADRILKRLGYAPVEISYTKVM